MRKIRVVIFVLVVMGGYLKGFAQEQDPFAENPGRGSVKAVQVYPNPATEFVHIKFEYLDVQHVRLTVHSLIGNEVPVETEVVDEHELKVRVKDLNTGYYLLAVKDNNSNFRGTYKFLKR